MSALRRVGRHIPLAWLFVATLLCVLGTVVPGRPGVIFAGTGVVLLLLVLIRALHLAERTPRR